MPAPDRRTIEQKIKEMYIPVTESGCWIWTGTISRKGYGIVFHEKRKHTAHRKSWEVHNGNIPDGLQLDHLCRVRCCINPYHLEPVSCRVNIFRGEGIAVRKAAQTHCIYGHELSGGNVIPAKNGNRRCLLCRRTYDRIRRYNNGWHTEEVKP